MSILEIVNYSVSDILMAGTVGIVLGIIIQGAWESFAPDDKCVWNFCDGFYRTSCGYRTCLKDVFMMELGTTPEENGLAFCPYCGRVLKTMGM